MASIGEYWLVSVPGEKTTQEAWDRLNRATSDMSNNHKFNIPDLKVGTLDQLVGLSDELGKLDAATEAIARKLVTYFAEVLEDERDKLYENLLVNGKDITQYITKFSWEAAKYPVKQSLKVLSEIISKQVTQIDNDLKTKANTYNTLKNNLASLERKATGSLMTRDLYDIVKADDFVLNSEYITTLLVVVPKALAKDWETKYESLADMVVPRSSRLINEDAEFALFSVSLFKKVVDEYKAHCRENKFIVRDFVYDEETLIAGKNERDKLTAEKTRQFAPLVRWLKINFSEIFTAYIHVKALRAFVESVLRYGLPVNFQAALLQPTKSTQKRLRSELNKLYQHLDGTAGGAIDNLDDSPALMALGMQEYFPYVCFKVAVDFVENIPHKR
uniref:V-type proton ATPase subunit C n=2 Tax=Plectus sambesii TaxID=2011161 RepID=A0A914VA14_9BILA